MKKAKPANQGSAGKASVFPMRKDGIPKAGNSKKGTTFFAKQPGGTKGSKNK
jgi:hypothetical protein